MQLADTAPHEAVDVVIRDRTNELIYREGSLLARIAFLHHEGRAALMRRKHQTQIFRRTLFYVTCATPL